MTNYNKMVQEFRSIGDELFWGEDSPAVGTRNVSQRHLMQFFLFACTIAMIPMVIFVKDSPTFSGLALGFGLITCSGLVFLKAEQVMWNSKMSSLMEKLSADH